MNGHCIRIREYDPIKVGERWDSARKIISRLAVDAIARHMDERGTPLFSFGYNEIRATNWVGSLAVGEHCIEVFPKIDIPDRVEPMGRARENLLHMIASAGFVPVTETGVLPLISAGKPLIISYMDLYLEHLTREWRRGAIREYVGQEENRTFLKGKILISDQLKANQIRGDRFFTRSDEFIEDNPIPRLLKAAVLVCLKQKFSSEVSRRAAGLVVELDSVQTITPTREEIRQASVDRRHARFEKVVNLAKEILLMSSPDQPSAGKDVYSLMFDMNEVFERFVAAELAMALRGTGSLVRYQVSGRSLLLREGILQFQLRPDLGVFQGKSVVCLLDTKWKRLDREKLHLGVSQTDMYQMYAYGKEYDSPLTILIYPWSAGLTDIVTEYHHRRNLDFDLERRILVATVDISTDMGTMLQRRKLREGLLRIVQYEGKNCVTSGKKRVDLQS